MKAVPFGLLGVVATLLLSSPLLACNHPHCKCHKAKVTTVTTTTTTRVPVTGQFVTQAAPFVVGQAAPLVVTQAAAQQTFTLQAAPQTFTLQAAPQMVAPQAGVFDFLNPLTPIINTGIDAAQVAQLRAIRGDLAGIKADTAAMRTSLANIEASNAAIRDLLAGKKAEGGGGKENKTPGTSGGNQIPDGALQGAPSDEKAKMKALLLKLIETIDKE